jgi:apolipoprotein N-acyltransferase
MRLVIISAVLGILAFPLAGLYPLGFVFLTPLFVFLIKERGLLRLLFGVFISRFILGMGMLFFAFDPIIFLLSIIIFLGLPLSVFFTKKFIKFLLDKYFHRFSNYQLPITNYSLLLFLPFLWTFWDLIEAKFSFLPTYVATAGNILGSSPFLGLAAIGGIAGLTFFVAVINSSITFLVLNLREQKLKISIIILVIIFIISGGYLISKSKLQKNASNYRNLSNNFEVALVSSANKFNQEFEFFKHEVLAPEEKIIAETLMEKKMNLIKDELSGKKIDLIILPEDLIGIESWQDSDPEAKNKFGIENGGVLIRAYRKLAQELNVNLAATLTTIQNGKRYNSTIVFNRQGELTDIYNKFNLTIGGEYWPFGNWQPFYYKFFKKKMMKFNQGRAMFEKEYVYERGEEKILKIENLIFGSAICSEAQYPWQIKNFKKLGATFISHTSTNRWVIFGLKNFRELTDNLRKIEAVWLATPILINGREERVGLITPDGKINSADFKSQDKDFGIFIGEVRI